MYGNIQGSPDWMVSNTSWTGDSGWDLTEGRILGGHRRGSGGRKYKGSKMGTSLKFQGAARRLM